MPTTPARARHFLKTGRAIVVRRFPFTIRLKDRTEGQTQPVSLKIDPGSKTTGIALVRADGEVLHLAEVSHRGSAIRKAMEQRRNFRRRRRSANLRYRAPRFKNRKSDRKLPPSLQSRVDNVTGWAARYRKLIPVTDIAMEAVRFDTQAMETPGIKGIEYQQGTMAGYEVREYLLEKWGRKCAYCGAEHTPLQVEHIVPRARGGSNRISNLTLACNPCNKDKAARPVEEFLAKKPAVLKKILAQAKAPLRDAAAVNVTRKFLFLALRETSLPVACSSGGRTKFNRASLGIPKTHALDAACVGETERLTGWDQPTLTIKAMGRGSYKRTRLDRHGFPRGYLMREKSVHGFQTGDMVRAVVPTGKKQGIHVGRVAIRATGFFNIQTAAGPVQGISHRYCRIIQRSDGYNYDLNTDNKEARIPPGPEGPGILRAIG
jgi:5-methylcytosine-specific restriction endonuclease McrA